jgi:hypothetical protein
MQQGPFVEVRIPPLNMPLMPVMPKGAQGSASSDQGKVKPDLGVKPQRHSLRTIALLEQMES